MTILTAAEFVALRTSSEPDDYRRAAHESASLEVWRDIIDRYPAMRFWVAQNKTVPLEILRLLSKVTDERVRTMVAMKRKCDIGLFEQLSADDSEVVRMAVARNKKVPATILKQLCNDPLPAVARIATSRIHARDSPEGTSDNAALRPKGEQER